MIGLYPGDELAFLFLKTLAQAVVLATCAWCACRLTISPTRRFAIAFAGLLTVFLLPVINGGANALGLRIAEVSLTPPVATTGVAELQLNPLHLAWEVTFTIWLLGMCFLLAKFSLGIYRIWKLRRSATILAWSDHSAIAEQVRERLSTKRLPPIATSREVAGPQVIGVWRPLVLLPEKLLDETTDRQVVAILVHECAHVVLSHPVAGFFQRLVLTLFWPNPALYGVSRQLHQASEDICDNYVIAGGSRIEFARTLLALAEQPTASPALGFFGRMPQLEQRIASLLNPQRRIETKMKIRDLATALVLSLTLSGLMASTSLAQTGNQKTKEAKKTQKTKEVRQQAGATYEVRFVKGIDTGHWEIRVVPSDAKVTKTVEGWTISVPNTKAKGKTVEVKVVPPQGQSVSGKVVTQAIVPSQSKVKTVVGVPVTASGVRTVEGRPISTAVNGQTVVAPTSTNRVVKVQGQLSTTNVAPVTVQGSRITSVAPLQVQGQVSVAGTVNTKGVNIAPAPSQVTTADEFRTTSVQGQLTTNRPANVIVPLKTDVSTIAVQGQNPSTIAKSVNGVPVTGSVSTTTVSGGRIITVTEVKGTAVLAPSNNVVGVTRSANGKVIAVKGSQATAVRGVAIVSEPAKKVSGTRAKTTGTKAAKSKDKGADDKGG